MTKKELKVRLLDLQSEFTGLESFLYSEIEKLKKENEDIKKALSVCNASNSFNKELTKAKEIIEKLISQNRKLWVYSDIREEAEQFLKKIGE